MRRLRERKHQITLLKLLFVIACAIGLYFLFTYNSNSLKENCKFTIGVVTGNGWAYKSGDWVSYTFVIDGRSYESSAKCTVIAAKKHPLLVGKQFMVVYDSTKIENSEMLFECKDYEEWGLECPDSLNQMWNRIIY